MNKILRSFLVLSGLILVFNVFAVTETRAQQINEILNIMQNHFKGLTTVSSEIKMVETNTQLGINETREGSVKMLPNTAKGRYIRLNWTKPEENIAINKDKFVLFRPRIPQLICGSTSSVQKSNKVPANSLSFMSMNKTQLKQSYDIKYVGAEKVSGGVDTWHLLLTPKVASNEKSADIWVDGDGMIRQAMVTQKNNDTVTVVLTGIVKNAKIETSEFVIKPKNVKCTAA